MEGLLADVNVQGHLNYVRAALASMDLWKIIEEAGLRFESFTGLGLASDLDDRSLWVYCQAEGWVLFTNDKNDDGPDSLHATLNDSWQMGNLPVLTLANQGRFVRDGAYTRRVAEDIAAVLLDIRLGGPLDRSRVYVPI